MRAPGRLTYLTLPVCLLSAFLLSSACGPAGCPVGDDLGTWQIHTNPAVTRTELPLDVCRRQVEARAELQPGGRIALSRAFTLPAAGQVDLAINATTTCPAARFTLRLDQQVVEAQSVRLPAAAGQHTVEVAAEATNDAPTCSVRLFPALVLP